MGNQGSEFVVRRNQRHDVALRARISVQPERPGGVRLAAPSGVRDGWLECDAVDFGAGGVGFLTPVFLPRRTLIRALVMSDPTTAPMLDAMLRVQRVVMTDRRPMYLLGTSFEKPTPQTHAQIAELLRALGDDAGGGRTMGPGAPGITGSAAHA